MLVLARKRQESVVIASTDDLHELVRVTVIEVSNGKVKLGFQAEKDLAIHREEVWKRVCDELTTSTPKVAVKSPVYRVSSVD